MGRLKRIEDTVNSTISAYGFVKVMPRGLPYYVDALLRGQVRFAKRAGNNIAVIRPDNTFGLASAIQQRDTVVNLRDTSPWITLDSLISLGPGKELHRVEDMVDNQIVLDSPTGATFSSSEEVLLYASPIEVAITANQGATLLSVRTHFPLVNGDVVAYQQTPGFIQSLTEIKVEEAQIGGTTSDPYFNTLYQLKLTEPLGRTLQTNEVIYIRAYPAYISQEVRVPNSLQSAEPLGPFLIDLLSGRLLEGHNFKETLAIKTLTKTGSYVLGSPYSFQTVEKNYFILDRPVPAHVPLFWTLAAGTMRFTPNRMLFRVDDLNQFCVGLKCVPHLNADHAWRVNLRSNEDCTIRFIFAPNAPQEFSIAAGGSITATLNIPPNSDPVTDLEINVLGQSDICEVSMSDWTSVKSNVDQVQYSFLIEATGQAGYLSTGMLFKPYFLTSDLLKAAYDQEATYDGGKVYF